MQPGDNQLPRPYLNREATNERLRALGFIFNPNGNLSESATSSGGWTDQRKQFVAIQELIAGAIAEWGDIKDDFGDAGIVREMTPASINEELLEWAEEWLIG